MATAVKEAKKQESNREASIVPRITEMNTYKVILKGGSPTIKVESEDFNLINYGDTLVVKFTSKDGTLTNAVFSFAEIAGVVDVRSDQ